MSRWHEVSCVRPDILVDTETKIPRCRACNSMPRLDELILEQSKAISPWSPPTEPPRGQWNLWSPNRDRAVNSNNPSEPRATDPPSSPIYKEPLNKNVFRLLCLSKAESIDSPIHVELEKHDDEYCPEYETVSYTWGGEDDDTRRQVPVYVGPYWDVLLQTKNCAFMLQYVRSRRASQFIWVDAICINQEDPIDRAAQVSKMSSIYQNCRRVIVYLENEEPHPKIYRPRQPLATINIEQLMSALKTRYFSRVWVIQELLLPPEALIPINSVDYLVDHRTSSILEKSNSSLDWRKTPAPWLQHMTAGAPYFEKGIFKALQQTASSQATDPRDKIYAVLGLLNQDRRRGLEQFSITPDYSLSFLETFVGLCNYYLSVNSHNASLFLNAAKWPSSSPYPSWVPNWRVPAIWDDVVDDYTGLDGTGYNNGYGAIRYRDPWRDPLVDPIAYIIYARAGRENPKSWGTIFCGMPHSTVPDWWGSITPISNTGGICLAMTHLLDISSTSQIIEDKTYQSARSFHIQGASAALYLCTQHFSLERIVTAVEEYSQVSLYFHETNPSESCLLWFLRKEGPTYSLVSCCRCYSLCLLAPRALDPHYNLGSFHLLLKMVSVQNCCNGYDTWGDTNSVPGLRIITHAVPYSLEENVSRGLLLAFVDMNPIASNIGAWWKGNQDDRFHTRRDDRELHMRMVFPCFQDGSRGWQAPKIKDVLRIYQAIISHGGDLRYSKYSPEFDTCYFNFVTLHCPDYSPRLQDGAIIFTYNQEQWEAWEEVVSRFKPRDVRTAAEKSRWYVQWHPKSGLEQYVFQKAPKLKPLRSFFSKDTKSSTSISLWLSLQELLSCLDSFQVYNDFLPEARFTSELRWVKDFAAMFKPGLSVTDLLEGNFVMPDAPTCVIGPAAEELGLDGRIERVTIL